MDESSPLLEPAEVAKWLNVTPQKLKYWRTKGLGPQYLRLGDRTVRYSRDDVLAWCEQAADRPHAANHQP